MKKKLATVMAATMAVSGSIVSVSAATIDEKIVGSNRIDTAVRISKEGWKSAETVILVNDSAIPDALTATPLAYAKNAPILLTGKNGLNKATADEIKRLGAKDVIMIGGDAVLSTNVEKDLKALNIKVDRVKGATREETALAIAKRLDGIKDVSEIAVVNGTTGLADAVSVAAAAAERNMPILLANPKKGLTASEKFIKDEAIKASFIIGGKTALPEKLVSSLPGKQRIEGSNRNDTNAKVIAKFYGSKELDNLYLAKDGMGDSGQLIDALAVGALAAKNGAPVLIASKKLSNAQVDVINTKKIDTITQIGGKGNEGAFNQLKDIEKTDVYEVGTVEELKEALAKANANDKIVLKPDATITEDIIINTDKNVDIKVEGTVTGKVEISAPNGNVTDNSTSKPSTGGGGSIVTPSKPENGAAIGGTYYKTVTEAINAATENATVTIYGENTLDSQLKITKGIKINGENGATLIAKNGFTTEDVVSNLVSVEHNGVEISNLIVKNAPGFGIHVYGATGVTLTSVTATNCGKGGLLVNSSEVKANGLTTSGNAWYGVDVDEKIDAKDNKAGKIASTFTLTGANISEGVQVYAEAGTVKWDGAHTYTEINSDGSTKGTVYSTNTTEKFGAGAIVTTENLDTTSNKGNNKGNYYKDFNKAVTDTKENGNIDIYGTNELKSKWVVSGKEGLKINGKNGAIIKPHKDFEDNTTDGSQNTLVLVSGVNKINLSNLTISYSKKHGLNIYESGHNKTCDSLCECEGVVLDNIILENNKASGIVVNGSAVTATDISASGNKWGQSIDVSQGSNVNLPSILYIDKISELKDYRKIVSDVKCDANAFPSSTNIKVKINNVDAIAKEVTHYDAQDKKCKFTWDVQ